jgi:hypothetical protein
MILKPFSPTAQASAEIEVVLTTSHPAALEGESVLVYNGPDGPIALTPLDAGLGDYRIVEASDIERQALDDSGFQLPDA